MIYGVEFQTSTIGDHHGNFERHRSGNIDRSGIGYRPAPLFRCLGQMSKEDNTFIGLLDAMWNRAQSLLMMQIDIEDMDFQCAMENQFEYLYWCDEVKRLLIKHDEAYWDLVFKTHKGLWS